MKKATIIVFLAVLLVGSAFTAGTGNGCKLQGTWIAEAPYPLANNPDFKLKFFSQYQGTGDNEGTDRLEWVNPPADPGTLWGNAQGVWEKSGPNKYNYTLIGHVINSATMEIIFIVRHVGTKTLIDCNTMEVTSTIEYLFPDMTPFMCIPSNATLKRVVMQGACVPQPQ